MLPVVMGSVLLLILFGRRLDALLLGDENAKTLGINVTAIRLMALGICAALTACIVAYCGGIGFVGLMIPHIVRRWVGVTSRALILGCVLIGGKHSQQDKKRPAIVHDEWPWSLSVVVGYCMTSGIKGCSCSSGG